MQNRLMPESGGPDVSFRAFLRDTFTRPSGAISAAAWGLFILLAALKHQFWLVQLIFVVGVVAIAVDFFMWKRPNSRRTRRP